MTHRPVHPTPRTVPGTAGQNLLRRVLGVRPDIAEIERVVFVDDERWTIALRDTGSEGTNRTVSTGDLAIHVLWQRDEEHARVIVDGVHHRIVPGDTITIPGGSTWNASGGMVIFEVSSRVASIGGIVGPSHGEEVFHGYNRQTLCATTPTFSLERWKITQPLTLEAEDDPYVIVDLIDPLAFTWPGGTDLIDRGSCRIVPPGLGPLNLLPDGLGYALIVR